MSKKSYSSKNILNSKLKSKRLLSSLFNPEEKNIFIKNNKNALKYYKEFIKMQENKTRNKKLTLEFLNLKSHEKIEKFKDNPILILKSYDKILFDEKKRKFKSQTLGVDEGLITVPKNYMPQFQMRNKLKNNLFLNEVEKHESNKELNINKKIKSVTELEKGCEIILVKNNNFIRKNSEKKIDNKKNKLKNNSENKLNYNFELKKLDNWDFLNVQTEGDSNKNLLILSNRNFRRKSSLIDITNENNSKYFQNVGYLLKMKNDKNRMKVISRIKKLKEFFKDFGKEQDILVFQDKNQNPKYYFLSAFLDDEKLLLENKNNKKENIDSGNFYKDMIKIKKKREKMMHEELYKYAEKINLARKAKEEYENEGFKLNQELKDINNEEINILNNIKTISNNKDKLNKNADLNNLYNNELESERKLIRTLSEEEQYNMQGVDSYRDKKHSHDDNNFNFSSEKRVFKRNYFLVKRRKNTIIFNNLSKIKKRRSSVINDIKENNLILKEKQMNLKSVKDKFNEKVKILKEYYYQILKKGLDVRKDGLSWIIVRLMELNAFIDKNHFPSFLSSSEIDYLMKIGIKKYELSELIKLFQILKNRQKNLKEEHIKSDKEKINKIKEEKFNKLLQSHRDTKYTIGNDYVEYLEEIQRKYENDINVYLNERTEEDAINKISDKINKYVLTMHDDDISENEENNDNLYEKFFIPGSLSQYFAKDKKFRQYFDDIYYLSKEINKRKNILKEMKDNEFKKYKNLIKDNSIMENKNIEISERRKTFAALFGHSISG